VIVTEVEKDSPAAAAKLQAGAYITRVAGTPVRTPREFRAAVAGKTGDVPLEVIASPEAPRSETRVVKP
jgi:S1-C subfamily serine protease